MRYNGVWQQTQAGHEADAIGERCGAPAENIVTAPEKIKSAEMKRVTRSSGQFRTTPHLS